jgi:hypothetical protein
MALSYFSAALSTAATLTPAFSICTLITGSAARQCAEPCDYSP